MEEMLLLIVDTTVGRRSGKPDAYHMVQQRVPGAGRQAGSGLYCFQWQKARGVLSTHPDDFRRSDILRHRPGFLLNSTGMFS